MFEMYKEGMSNSVLRTSPTRQYTLREKLQSDLLYWLESGEDYDISFQIEGSEEEVYAHSSIVAVRCKSLAPLIAEFLERERSDASSERSVLVIPVCPVSKVALKKVLGYVYTGTIELDCEDLFDICTLSTFFRVGGLQNIVYVHLRNTESVDLMTTVLDRALQTPEGNQLLIAQLTQHFAQDCSKILRCAPVSLLSRDLMMHIVKQEDLWASELEIWNALIAWSCAQCGIVPEKGVSSMTVSERQKVAVHMQDFCQPGFVRTLNFETTAFASEVEPLGVFPEKEVLLKYRFDAAAGLAPFDHAFPLDRYNFLTRIRQRTMCFESSSHPHPRGVSIDFKVEMPIWTSLTKVTFDPKTSLGRYADLEFFADEGRRQRIFSLRGCSQSYSTTAQQNTTLKRSFLPNREPLEPVFIDGHVFWFSFYAPQNVGNLGWGYKFFVSIVR